MAKITSNLRNTKMTPTYLDIYTPALIPDFNQANIITLDQQYDKRPDLLAYNLYGDASVWWVFTLYNRNTIVDPIRDFVTGLTIYVPNKNAIAGV